MRFDFHHLFESSRELNKDIHARLKANVGENECRIYHEIMEDHAFTVKKVYTEIHFQQTEIEGFRPVERPSQLANDRQEVYEAYADWVRDLEEAINQHDKISVLDELVRILVLAVENKKTDHFMDYVERSPNREVISKIVQDPEFKKLKKMIGEKNIVSELKKLTKKESGKSTAFSAFLSLFFFMLGKL